MIHIDFASFFKKGLTYNDDYSITMILGPQGTGKTYLGVKLCEDLLKKGKYKLKTNIRSFLFS